MKTADMNEHLCSINILRDLFSLVYVCSAASCGNVLELDRKTDFPVSLVENRKLSERIVLIPLTWNQQLLPKELQNFCYEHCQLLQKDFKLIQHCIDYDLFSIFFFFKKRNIVSINISNFCLQNHANYVKLVSQSIVFSAKKFFEN